MPIDALTPTRTTGKPGIIRGPSPYVVRVVDIAALRDVDATVSGVYLAYSIISNPPEPTPVSIWYSEADTDWKYLARANQPCAMGSVVSVPGVGRSDVVDNANTIRVRMYAGSELESVTADEVRTGVNLAIAGDEIIQFQTATLVDASTYDLTGLRRALLGTEQANHQAGELFALVSRDMHFIPFDASMAGAQLAFKVAPASDSSAMTATVTSSLASSLPSPPTDFRFERTSGDLVMTWQRVSRISHRMFGPNPTPLPEGSESYDVVIDPDGVAREKTGLSSPTVTYTSAEQSTDSLTGAEIVVEIYQNDATRGRGRPLVVTVPAAYDALEDESATSITDEAGNVIGTGKTSGYSR